MTLSTLHTKYIKILLKTCLGVSSKKDNSWCVMSSATSPLLQIFLFQLINSTQSLRSQLDREISGFIRYDRTKTEQSVSAGGSSEVREHKKSLMESYI